MKRVIALSFFKKVVNRLFGPDDDDKVENIYEEPENKYDEIPENHDTKQGPLFRFPIISDAEIYGWEDEPTPERERPKTTAQNEESEEDYETIPLYENERWKGDRSVGTIYKAGSALKYGVEPGRQQTQLSTNSTTSEKKQVPPAKASVQKRSNRPFIPTSVPSPVHGYTPAKKEVVTEWVEERQEQLLEDEAVFTPVAPPVVEEQPVDAPPVVSEKEPVFTSVAPPVVEEQLVDAPPVVSEKEPVFTPVEPPVVEEQLADTPPVELLEKETVFMPVELPVVEEQLPPVESLGEEVQSSHVPEVLSPVEEERTVVYPSADEVIEEQTIVSSHVKEDFIAEVEPPRVPSPIDEMAEDTPGNLGITSQNTEHTTDNEYPVVDSESLPVESESVTENNKERIVPFNVLMLKSDKEKLEAKQAIMPKVEALVEKKDEVPNIISVSEPLPAVTASAVNEDVVEEEPYYALPSLDLLIPPEAQIEDTEWLETQSEKLEEALSHFAVQANVIEAVQGPTVTRFELTVGQGTKVSKVRNLTDDLKLALAAEDIRIQAPIPGRSSIGIEIPNRKTRPVRISEVIGAEKFQSSSSPLEAVLGLSLTGTPVTLDLCKMPHGMIAGATGSGKSVCINSILVSLLYKASPTDLKMMLIDPKMVELAPFNGIPHLISPVITDVKAATAALKWAVAEMERRYELLAHAGVRDIERYNKVVTESRRFSLKMPYLLIVIDELADLMMMAPADVEVSISRIAQKARACGIHLIIATQRPSVDVITGTIKANVPTRIAFSVSSQIDSRTIIDSPGAERLLGRGDMLYIGNGKSSAARLQGTFVTDDEIERIIEHVRNEATPTYLFGQEDLLASAIEEEETDPLFEEACKFILEQGSASTSLLQRNFSIGYNRAAKLIDRMEKSGFISGQRGSKARDVYLTESDVMQLRE